MPTLWRAAPASDQGLCGFSSGDVARDNLKIRVGGFHFPNRVQNVFGMAVCRIHDDNIHMGVDQGLHALHHIGGNADAGAAEQTSLGRPFAERGYLICFSISLIVISPLRLLVVIHDGEFLFSGFREK